MVYKSRESKEMCEIWPVAVNLRVTESVFELKVISAH